MIFPRTFSLGLVRSTTVIGVKRRFSESKTATKRQASSMMIKQIDSLSESREGQIVRVSIAGVEEYRVYRMRDAGKSQQCAVFQAKLSSRPNELVLVKVLKRSLNYNAVTRGETWLQKYSIYRRLQSVSLQPNLGGNEITRNRL
jgi:hypothetical protein